MTTMNTGEAIQQLITHYYLYLIFHLCLIFFYWIRNDTTLFYTSFNGCFNPTVIWAICINREWLWEWHVTFKTIIQSEGAGRCDLILKLLDPPIFVIKISYLLSTVLTRYPVWGVMTNAIKPHTNKVTQSTFWQSILTCTKLVRWMVLLTRFLIF